MTGTRNDDGYDDGYDDGSDDDLEWTDEDEERYQARIAAERRRKRVRRRQGWSFAVLVLLVGLIGLGGAGVVQGWWEWPFGRDGEAGEAAGRCPTPTSTLAAPGATQVEVLNATDRRGLASDVATQLTQRGYTVAGIGNDDSGVPVPEPAQVRHGPEGLLQAQTVAINVPGAVLVDDGRPGTQVEVALGEGFAALATPEQVAAALAPVAPTASPAGCTPAPTTPPATPPVTDPAATTPAPTG